MEAGMEIRGHHRAPGASRTFTFGRRDVKAPPTVTHEGVADF